MYTISCCTFTKLKQLRLNRGLMEITKWQLNDTCMTGVWQQYDNFTIWSNTSHCIVCVFCYTLAQYFRTVICTQGVLIYTYYFHDAVKRRSCLQDISRMASRLQEWVEQKSDSSCRADHTEAMDCEDSVYKGWWRVHLSPWRRYYWPWLLAQGSWDWRIHTEGQRLAKLLTRSYNIFVHFARELFSPTWPGLWILYILKGRGCSTHQYTGT